MKGYSMTYITYLGCDNSSLEFTLSNKKVLKAKTPAEISEILISYDKDSYMCSSSMDFAKEYGFKTNDGANKLYKKGYKLALKTLTEGRK